MRLTPVLLAAIALAPARARAQDTATSIETLLTRRLAASPAATVGVYYRNLATGDSVTINADLVYHAASTMKVAVMTQLFRDVDAGRMSLEQKIPVVNAFHSLIGDTVFQLDSADDSERSLYRVRAGDSLKVKDLVEPMITWSSNFATDLLIDRIGADRVQATLHGLGIDSMRVRRGVEDGPAFRAGLNNTTTARALGQLLYAIVDADAASPQSCGRMLDILQHQHFNTAIPAGLPHGTRVAHKTGDITALLHDAAIVYKDNRPRYILVVLTRGIQDQAQSAALIADLSRLVWNKLYPPPPPPAPHHFGNTTPHP